MSRPLDRVAVAAMLVLCVSWGAQQVAGKVALVEVPPLTQAALRAAVAAVLVAGWAWWRDPQVFRRDGTGPAGLLIGTLFAGEFAAIFLGLNWTTAGHAVLFLYTAPFFIALGLRWWVPDEGLSTRQWAGMALSFVGVVIALGVSGATSALMLRGDLLALLGGALWGATTLTVKTTKLRTAPPVKVLMYQLAVSAPLQGVAAWAAGEHLTWPWSGTVLASMTYQTVWVVSISFLVWFELVKRYRAGELAAFTFLTPPVGLAAGALILGEPIGPGFAVAVALVAAGIILVNWPGRAVPPSAASAAGRPNPG